MENLPEPKGRIVLEASFSNATRIWRFFLAGFGVKVEPFIFGLIPSLESCLSTSMCRSLDSGHSFGTAAQSRHGSFRLGFGFG